MKNEKQSPEYARMSQATAISLGLTRGRMYRGAKNRCVNLLVHFPEGCSANCAYCGLAKKRDGSYGEKSFIHVAWPLLPMLKIIDAVNRAPSYVTRTCISMITNGKCRSATLSMLSELKSDTALPISVLISPTILKDNDLKEMKEQGADKIGVAIDLATPELFDQYRGKGVSGPHKWNKYWEILESARAIFGYRNVGAHLMVGMGETEEQMVRLMDRLRQMGVENHLFSFFAEQGSALGNRPQPPWPVYLRVQLARYIIEEGLGDFKGMVFDPMGKIVSFGLDKNHLQEIIGTGIPFMTTGCLGPDGEVACNRPFGNCLPDVGQWNYPYPPNQEEIRLIRENIFKMDS